MDINQFFRVAESRGLEAINAIRSSNTSILPKKDVVTSISESVSSAKPLYTPMEPLKSLGTISYTIPTKINLYPKQLYPTQLYTPIKSTISIATKDATLSQINVVYPAKLTSETKPFELPDISKFPKLSEMIFGETAARFNRFVTKLPNTFYENEDKALQDFKLDLDNKLQSEIQKGQGDSLQATKLRNDLAKIDSAIRNDSFFYKNQVRRDISDSYITGSLAAGNVQTGANLWSVAKSIYDQFVLSEDEKKKVQEQAQVIDDPLTKFFDNVLEDLRPSKELQGLTPSLIESIGGMGGLMVGAGLAKSPYAQTLLATTLESLAEGGATYQENRKKGMSVEEAFNRQASVIGMNFVLNYITNRYTRIFENVPDKELKGVFKKGLNLLGTSLGEGGQEAGQQLISNLATNRPWDEGLLESFGFGVVIGGGVGSVRFIHRPTNTVVYEKKVAPNVVKELADDSLSVINGVAGTNVNINSSIEEITKAYYQAVSIAANIPDASGLYGKLDTSFQIINSYKNALGQVRFKSEIDPDGTMSNVQFAKERTKKGLKAKEIARGQENNAIKRKYNELKDWYDGWVNNVEVPGKVFQILDEIRMKRLGRELKPGESVDIPYDQLYQISNIVESSPEYNEITSIARDLKNNKLDVDEFGQYLESRRNLILAEQGVKKDVNIEQEMRTVAGFERAYGKYAERYYKVMDSIANKIWQSGLITTQEYIYISQNKDYAPFRKIFDVESTPVYNELMKTKNVGLGKQTIFRKIESSKSQEVENPFIMSLPYIYQAYYQTNKNEVGLALIDSIETGDFQAAGFQGKIVQTAEDGRRKQLIRDLKPEVEKLVSKVTKLLKKKKKAAKELQKEIISMIQEGYKIVSLNDTEEIDTVTQNRLTRKVETQLNKRDELMEDAEDIFQDILKTKKRGEDVFKDQKYTNKINRILETRNEWLSDLIDLGADMLTKKGKKFMADSNLKFPNKKQRKNFIKTASTRDIYDFLYEFYDLPQADFNKLLAKAEKNNLKITQVLQEIRNIKDAQVVNTVVNSLIQLPSAEVDALYAKYGKTQKAIGKVITELKRLTDARITNAAVNSLIKSTPEELTKIKKKLEKKYPIMDQLMQDVLDAQTKLDEDSGYLQRLEEIESEIETAKTAGFDTVEAFKDGYVIKAIVDKTIGESMKVTNNPESVKKIMKFLNFVSSWVKIGAVVVNPELTPKLFLYDQQSAALFSKNPFKTSALNVPTFGNALITTMTSGPFLSKLYTLFPERFQSGIKAWEDFQRAGGASSELFIGSKKKSEQWLKSGGKNKVSIGGIVNFFGKTDQITRFQIFLVNKQLYLDQGFTEQEASTKAAYDARNTLPNFYRRSNTLRTIDAFKPFIAAAIQSGSKLRNEIRKNPEQTIDRLMYMAAFYALSMLWNLSSEERRKAWAGIPEWMKNNNVIFLFDEKDENNNPYYAPVPIEQSTMSTMQGTRRSIEGMASADAEMLLGGLSDLMEGLYGVKIPTSTKELDQEIAGGNPLLRLPIELNSNYNFFTSREIVDQRLQGLPAYQQFDDKTSEFAKYLGRQGVNIKEKKYGISPKKIDHALNAFGQIGDSVRDAFKKVQAGTATEEEKKLVNKYEGTLKGLFYKNVYGAEEQKLWEEKAQADLEKQSINFDIGQALDKGDFETAKNLANNNLTKEQWKGVENAFQERQIKETLSGKERVYFQMPTSYLETIKEKNPAESKTIDKVIQLKKTVTKLPNLDTSNITFKPSTSGGGFAKIKTRSVKIGKVAKPRKIRIKGPAKPKKIKVSKPKQIKRPKLVKIKPLKKFRRV